MFSGFWFALLKNIFVWAVVIVVFYRLRIWMLEQAGATKTIVNNYRYRGILLLTGLPGSGKTYKMIAMMLQSLSDGRHVRVNFNVRYDKTYIALKKIHRLSHSDAVAAIRRITYLDDWEDYIDAYDCDVYIDECQDVMDSKEWHYIPNEFVTWGAQHRHRKCRIVLAAHRFGKIHTYWRELIASIEMARPAAFYMKPFYNFIRGNKYPLLHYLAIKDPEEEVTDKPRAKKGLINKFTTWSLLPLDPMIANCYDHEGGVRVSPLTKLLKDQKKHKIELELKPRRAVYSTSEPSPLDCSKPYVGLDDFISGAKPFDYSRFVNPPSRRNRESLN